MKSARKLFRQTARNRALPALAQMPRIPTANPRKDEHSGESSRRENEDVCLPSRHDDPRREKGSERASRIATHLKH